MILRQLTLCYQDLPGGSVTFVGFEKEFSPKIRSVFWLSGLFLTGVKFYRRKTSKPDHNH
jgi:hypothetical protein